MISTLFCSDLSHIRKFEVQSTVWSCGKRVRADNLASRWNATGALLAERIGKRKWFCRCQLGGTVMGVIGWEGASATLPTPHESLCVGRGAGQLNRKAFSVGSISSVNLR